MVSYWPVPDGVWGMRCCGYEDARLQKEFGPEICTGKRTGSMARVKMTGCGIKPTRLIGSVR